MIYLLITLVSFLFAYLVFRYEKLVIKNNTILEHYNEELESELKKRTAQLNKQKKQLQESEFRWKFAVDGRGDGLWDWNVNTNEVYFSKAWKEMLGFKEDEIQGSLEEWERRVHPDDLDKVYRDINSHINGETEIYSNEHRVKCKDGSYKWVDDRGMVVQRDENGKPNRLIGTHTDISERKETEFKMQQALAVYENTNEGIMITNAKNEIIDVNHSFCKTTGYSYDEVIGKNPSILKSDIKETDFYKQMWKELKETGIWYGEITNKKKNGELYEEYLSINTIKNNDGTVINYIGIFSDISVLKQQEKIILQQARTSAIGEMIGNIAHQWRQPLSAISTASTGLKVQLELGMGISKKEIMESLEQINSQTQFLSKTIEDFRGFFSEDLSAVFEFEIGEVIDKVNDLTKDSFKINFVQVYYDIEKEIFILGNKNLLIQALINIYNNALDVLKEKDGKRLLFICIKKDDSNITLSIKDNGGGICSSNIEKIFDPYFTTKYRSQGIGIGLYMTYQIIVKQLKGTIFAKNIKYEYDGEEFTGALFTITIPIK